MPSLLTSSTPPSPMASLLLIGKTPMSRHYLRSSSRLMQRADSVQLQLNQLSSKVQPFLRNPMAHANWHIRWPEHLGCCEFACRCYCEVYTNLILLMRLTPPLRLQILDRLSSSGALSWVAKWLLSYFTNRRQRVCLNGRCSSYLDNNVGFPHISTPSHRFTADCCSMRAILWLELLTANAPTKTGCMTTSFSACHGVPNME